MSRKERERIAELEAELERQKLDAALARDECKIALEGESIAMGQVDGLKAERDALQAEASDLEAGRNELRVKVRQLELERDVGSFVKVGLFDALQVQAARLRARATDLNDRLNVFEADRDEARAMA